MLRKLNLLHETRAGYGQEADHALTNRFRAVTRGQWQNVSWSKGDVGAYSSAFKDRHGYTSVYVRFHGAKTPKVMPVAVFRKHFESDSEKASQTPIKWQNADNGGTKVDQKSLSRKDAIKHRREVDKHEQDKKSKKEESVEMEDGFESIIVEGSRYSMGAVKTASGVKYELRKHLGDNDDAGHFVTSSHKNKEVIRAKFDKLNAKNKPAVKSEDVENIEEVKVYRLKYGTHIAGNSVRNLKQKLKAGGSGDAVKGDRQITKGTNIGKAIDTTLDKNELFKRGHINAKGKKTTNEEVVDESNINTLQKKAVKARQKWLGASKMKNPLAKDYSDNAAAAQRRVNDAKREKVARANKHKAGQKFSNLPHSVSEEEMDENKVLDNKTIGALWNKRRSIQHQFHPGKPDLGHKVALKKNTNDIKKLTSDWRDGMPRKKK